MKFGIKTYCDENFLDFFKDKCDFFEVQAIRGKDYSFLKKYDLPIVIHCEHQGWGVNPADISLKEKNLESFRFAQKIANEVGAKKIIIHPGIFSNKNCSKENSINFLKSIKDDRVLIENLPLKNTFEEGDSVCSTPSDMKEFLEKTKKGFCLDFNHAVFSAISHKKEIYDYFKEFVNLKPSHFHLGGQKIFLGVGHLSFSDSELDLKKVFEVLEKEDEVTLETTTDVLEVENDLNFLKEFK